MSTDVKDFEAGTPPVAVEARLSLPPFVHAKDHLLAIGGDRVPARSGEFLTNTDPVTEQPLARVPRGDSADVDAGVRAARAAFENASWAQLSPDRRGQLLDQIAGLLERHGEELATIDSVNMGAPLFLTTGMLREAAQIFRFYAGWPSKVFGTTVPLGSGRFGYSLRESLGVVGIIWGWNGPMGQLPGKLAPALATGNTVVLKPPETASLSTLRLAELLNEETDLPAGVVNVVSGLGNEAGEALVAHPDVAKISFTGSTAIGKHVQELASRTLKKVTLELGGKSPTVVFADADLQMAARGGAAGFLGNAGQACVAGSRVFVQESVRDEYLAGLTEMMTGTFTPGDPLTAGTLVGALSSRAQYDRVSGYLDIAREEGAHVVTGGQRYGDHGFFYTPTLLDEVTPEMRVVREEIFGPVGVIATFSDVDDALAKANDTEYGLAASIWTTKLSTAHRMAAGIQAGTIWVNTWGEMSTGELPFGGYKQSGLGREGGLEALDAYTQAKAVRMAI